MSLINECIVQHSPFSISLSQLIKRCWDENPNTRPDFNKIKTTLYNINPSKKSPVDMMMQLMEKYSKHLETLVAERTQDLVLEKQKTDRLLYSKTFKYSRCSIQGQYHGCFITEGVVKRWSNVYCQFKSIIAAHFITRLQSLYRYRYNRFG